MTSLELSLVLSESFPKFLPVACKRISGEVGSYPKNDSLQKVLVIA